MSRPALQPTNTVPLPSGQLTPLPAPRIAGTKAAYSTRRVDFERATQLLAGDVTPQTGDLVLARILKIGQHRRIELHNGRRALLYERDEVIVSYAARYAPDQFEAYVPEDLDECDLVAAGGVAAHCVSRHRRMKPPTRLQPLGLLADTAGERLNLWDWKLAPVPSPLRRPLTIAVLGTMMNAGKTTCAADLIQGFKQRGWRVGAAKVTGTGAGGDRWAVTDAGADVVVDFTDAGVASTFGLNQQTVEDIFIHLNNHLAISDAEVIVLEVADGLCQRETAGLLRSEKFRSVCDGILFAAGDAFGALGGVRCLRNLGLNVMAVGGALTASTLSVNEAQQVLDIPILDSRQLRAGVWPEVSDQLGHEAIDAPTQPRQTRG